MTARDEKMFFNSWIDLLHVVVVGTMVYVALIVSLRITGNAPFRSGMRSISSSPSRSARYWRVHFFPRPWR